MHIYMFAKGSTIYQSLKTAADVIMTQLILISTPYYRLLHQQSHK